MKDRLAIFDFCHTLTDFYTADTFIDFALEGRRNGWIMAKDFLRSLLAHARLTSGDVLKRKKIALLKGFSEDYVRSRAAAYSDTIVIPRIRPILYNLIQEHRSKGDFIVILSGGYDVYLNLLKQYLGADLVVATKIKFRNALCEGTIDGLDCTGSNKIVLLKQALNLERFDLSQSFSYSDSESDLPLLNLVGNGTIVSRQANVSWNAAHQFNVLVVP